jgi:hypothetical protein
LFLFVRARISAGKLGHHKYPSPKLVLRSVRQLIAD